jgi:hypothetical protein
MAGFTQHFKKEKTMKVRAAIFQGLAIATFSLCAVSQAQAQFDVFRKTLDKAAAQVREALDTSAPTDPKQELQPSQQPATTPATSTQTPTSTAEPTALPSEVVGVLPIDHPLAAAYNNAYAVELFKDNMAVLEEDILGKFTLALVELNYAQAKFLEALDEKAEADKVLSEIKALTSPDLSAEERLNPLVATSKSMGALIQDKMATQQEISDERRAIYTDGLVHYGMGLYASRESLDEVKGYMTEQGGNILRRLPWMKENPWDAIDIVVDGVRKANPLVLVAKSSMEVGQLNVELVPKLLQFSQEKNIEVPESFEANNQLFASTFESNKDQIDVFNKKQESAIEGAEQ